MILPHGGKWIVSDSEQDEGGSNGFQKTNNPEYPPRRAGPPLRGGGIIGSGGKGIYRWKHDTGKRPPIKTNSIWEFIPPDLHYRHKLNK